MKAATTPTMNRPLSLALCTALAMAPAAASADETYRLCGGGSAGFIRVGGAVACIPDAAPEPAPSKPQPAVQAGTNREVDDALNSADLAFGDGETKTACGWVRSAITSDITDFGGVPSSKAQREQLKTYAKRCNLRY